MTDLDRKLRPSEGVELVQGYLDALGKIKFILRLPESSPPSYALNTYFQFFSTLEKIKIAGVPEESENKCFKTDQVGLSVLGQKNGGTWSRGWGKRPCVSNVSTKCLREALESSSGSPSGLSTPTFSIQKSKIWPTE